jgi:hypothetical protein
MEEPTVAAVTLINVSIWKNVVLPLKPCKLVELVPLEPALVIVEPSFSNK